MFVVCDYSAIEARVLSWLAGESWRMDVFRTHGKIYEATAAKLYNVSIDDIKPKDKRRDHGKVAELALGHPRWRKCSYGNGWGLDKVGLSYGQLVDTVNAWRNANPNIVKLWTKASDAVVYCARYREVASIADNITCEMYGDTMYIALPSGRYIAYPGITHDKEGVSYEDNDRKRTKVHLYGGKIVENIVQGIARDCLAEAMLRIDAQDYRIVGHVHDEVIVEVDADDTEAPDIIKSIFDQAPAWANGLTS